MKIAVCISGHLRDIGRHKDAYNDGFLRPLREKHDVDIFVVTYDKFDTLNSPKGIEDRMHIDGDRGLNSGDLDYLGALKTCILSSEEIKKYFQLNTVYPNHDINFNGRNAKYHVINGELISFSQLCGIYFANNLKRQIEMIGNFYYDAVFRARPDFILENFESVVEPLFDQIEDKIFVPKIYKEEFAIADTFAFGSSLIMDFYSSAASRYRYLVDNYNAKKYPYPENESNALQFQSERILYRQLLDCGVPIVELPIKLRRA